MQASIPGERSRAIEFWTLEYRLGTEVDVNDGKCLKTCRLCIFQQGFNFCLVLLKGTAHQFSRRFQNCLGL